VNSDKDSIAKGTALKFIILMGVVSLFGDITYEGARSITGPFLAVLGANAAVVGFVAGFGELVGYGLRFVSGYIADRTRRYWTMAIIGYFVNLLAVPLLCFAKQWEIAALLMIAERLGKAIRAPARDAMLSHAAQSTGTGWGFGLHEALDQIGALLGPLVVALVFYINGGYRAGFAVLFIPAVICLCVLLTARFLYPRPQDLETQALPFETKGFRTAFWLYISAVACVAAGYADFPLIAFHFKKTAVVADNWIPVLYSLAMGADALSALVIGRLYDRFGIKTIITTVVLSLLFAPFVFSYGIGYVIIGVILWGIGLGAQESILRAVVADLAPQDKRATAYGIFNAGYGLFWFLGSALMGILYTVSIPAVIIFSVVMQCASLPILVLVSRRNK